MFLWWIGVLLGVSSYYVCEGVLEDSVCYGSDYRMPTKVQSYLSRTQLYFAPSVRTSRRKSMKLVMDKLELKDPRYSNSSSTLTIPDVTEKDDGTFAVTYDSGRPTDVLKLRVLDCSDKKTLEYGRYYPFRIPKDAASLELSPLGAPSEAVVLWNISQPQSSLGGFGEVDGRYFRIQQLTQAEQGYYTFRSQDKRTISRTRLEVEVTKDYYTKEEGEDLTLTVHLDPEGCTVIFSPDRWGEAFTILQNGRIVDLARWNGPDRDLWHRLEVVLPDSEPMCGIKIKSIELSDIGVFQFRDKNNNLAWEVELTVNPASFPSIWDAPIWVYVVLAIGIISLVACCCCLKKCCCKKNTSKPANSANTPAQTVIYHDNTSQPPGPSYPSHPPGPSYPSHPPGPSYPSHPPGPSYPSQPSGPTYFSQPPPVSSVKDEGVVPSFPLASDFLSADSGTQFELPQGLGYPSPPLLSSDTPTYDTYTSDKLNFR